MKISVLLMIITCLLYFMIGARQEKAGIIRIGQSRKIDRNNLFLYIMCLILILVAGFRGDFSSDYPTYYYQFKIFANQSFSYLLKSRDIGFALYSKLMWIITHNLIWCFIGMAIVMIFFYGKAIKRDSVDCFLSILLFIAIDNYIVSFNLMRHILVASILFYATAYIWRLEPIKYFGFVIVATLVHRSAIIMFPMYWLLRIDYRKRKNAFLLMVEILAFIFIMIFTRSTALFVQRIIGMDYTSYSNYGLDSGSWGSALKYLALFIFIVFCKKYINYKDIRERVWVNGCVFATAFQLMATRVLVMKRASYFVSSFFILLLPMILFRMKKKKRIVVKTCLIIAIFIYCMFIQNVIDYYPFWQNVYITY